VQLLLGVVAHRADLDLPLLSFRMDEIRAALLRSELQRLPIRLEAFRRNYTYVARALHDLPIAIRQPAAPGAFLGESLIFRVPDAEWFAYALRAEGIDARNLGSDRDTNVRAFWNWRFLFGRKDVAAIKAMLPNTARYLAQAVDIPLSSSLSRLDCDQLVTSQVVGELGALGLGPVHSTAAPAFGKLRALFRHVLAEHHLFDPPRPQEIDQAAEIAIHTRDHGRKRRPGCRL